MPPNNKQISDKRYYQALLARDSHFEGIFFVGVITTGVFCRPTCPARKPKFENCEFFGSAEDALLAAYRPCKRCRPLSLPNELGEVVKLLIEKIEAEPTRRWKEADFENLPLDVSTARRQFKKRFGMTFIQYARARRLGIAGKEIQKGRAVVDAQLEAGYESGSGFRDAFAQIMGASPYKFSGDPLIAAWLDTPLGPMVSVADDDQLYLLEFTDRKRLEKEIERLQVKTERSILPGHNAVIEQLHTELANYFEGTLKAFSTPVCLIGTAFQEAVWRSLQEVPYGETRSYREIAQTLNNPSAFRAVASANGANQLAIIVPCHRVIRSSGSLAGYGGGLTRKQWLLNHEKKNDSTR